MVDEREPHVVEERVICAEFLERTILLAPIQKVVYSRRPGRQPTRADVLYPDQTVRLFKWQRAQQDRLDHAEHGGASTDAQREREHRNDGEPGVLQQHPDRIAKVLHITAGSLDDYS